MTALSPRRQVTAAVLDDERDAVVFPTCPMCHTAAPLTQNAIDAGGDWRCARCGQSWDAGRLSAVAAYAAWVVRRDGAGAAPHADSPLARAAPGLPNVPEPDGR